MYFFGCRKYMLARLIYRYCWLLLLCSPVQLSAQLWKGNLGAPVVNITFGAGPSSPLPFNTTSYSYTNGCPSAGSYSIEHFLNDCFSNTWILLTGDYNHDTDGNYMVVNGSTSSGTVLAQTVSGLCGNTTYQFSAFLANCMKKTACNGKPVLPNLTFSIEATDGKILESYNTGDLPINEIRSWDEYGVCFTTPLFPDTVILRIKSNATGSCGSSFVMDGVSLKPAGPAITISLDGQDIQTIDLCSGYTNPLLLKATYTTGYVNPAMHWQHSIDTGKTWLDIPGANSTSYFIPRRKDSAIEYRFGMAEQTNEGNTSCTINSQTIMTNVHANPASVPLQKVLGCLNKTLFLKAPPNFYSYQWKGPNGFKSDTSSPVISHINFGDEGLYTVLATGNFGCTILDSFQVNVSPSTTISVANTLYSVCEGSIVHLAATGEGNYAWTPKKYLSNSAVANPFATPADSIQYKVVLTNSYGCQDSALVNINVFKKVVVSAGADKTILLGDSIVLDGLVQGTAVNYYWTSAGSMVNNLLMQPVVSPAVETQYVLYASSMAGCGNASDIVTVHVYKDVFMPKAFTPNGDGINDVYHVFNLNNYQLVSFSIFNRYGAKVFSTANAAIGWNGYIKDQPQETGAYTYYLEMKHASGKKISRKGSILLIR